MIINEIITKDEMTWYLNKINALKQYGCEWRTARRICMLILWPKGFKSCCTFEVLYPVEGNLSIYSQFWVKSFKIPALLDCTNSNRYVGEVPIIRREMLYIVHIVREGIGVATGLGKISWAQLFEGRLALNPGLNLTQVSFSCVQKHFLR